MTFHDHSHFPRLSRMRENLVSLNRYSWRPDYEGEESCLTRQWPLTSWSCLRLALSFFIWLFSSACASASFSFFGATTLITRSYTSSARTHLHRPSQAFDAFFTSDGSKSGFDIYLTHAQTYRDVWYIPSVTLLCANTLQQYAIFSKVLVMYQKTRRHS